MDEDRTHAPLPRVALEEQMALYCVFHRSRVNRVLHAIALPVILFSGFALLAPVALPQDQALGRTLPWNVGLAIVTITVAAFALLDGVATLAMAAWGVPLLILADALTPRLSLPALLALNLLLQAVAWLLVVQVGHERFEPTLLSADVPGDAPAPVSSNLYFRRGYFLLRNVGRRVSLVESFQQFAIGPFATTLDVLFVLGYRPELRERIRARADVYLARLARGEPVFSVGEPVASNESIVAVRTG